MLLEDDRNYYQAELADNRLFGRAMSAAMFYSDNPRAGQVSILTARPFYSLSQKWGGEILFSTLRRRLDHYVTENLAARDRFFKRRLRLQVSYRIGQDNIKYHFTPRYEYIDLDSLGMDIFIPAAAQFLPSPSIDSLIHYFQYAARVQQIKYAAFDRLNRFHKSEDIILGFDSRIAYGHASKSRFRRFRGTYYHYFSYWPQYTLAFGANLMIAGIQQQEWRSKNSLLRRMLNCYFRGYNQYHNNHTFAMGVQYLSNRLADKSFTLHLDEDHGLRGYPAFILNGEDRLVINIENRYFSDIEILSVGIGGVIFADIANIWSRESDLVLDNTQYSFGAGFRFGISRSTKGEVIRVDFAYAPRRKAWQISFGTGQIF
jgi:hypothetical protein